MNTKNENEAGNTGLTESFLPSDGATCYASSRRGLSGGGMLALLAMSGMINMGLPRIWRNRSAQDERNDPSRAKTTGDLRKLEAARIKRERKAAKHSRHNVEVKRGDTMA